MGKEREKICVNCHTKIIYGYGTKPSVCPTCGNQWWDKPADEFLLLTLQDDYIKSGRKPDKISPMYDGLIRYSENLIKKNLKTTSKFLDPERIHELAEDATLNFLQVYLKKPDYVVEDSFGGLLRRYVSGVMYSDKTKMHDQMTSLDTVIAEDMKIEDNVLRFMEMTPEKEKFELDAWDEYQKSHPDLVEDLNEIIVHKSQVIKKQRSAVEGILFLTAMRNFFLKNKKCSIDEFYDYYGDDLKFDIDDCLDKIRRRLKNAR